jgi:uncharacterized protein YndB with AHSA1/START domain
VTTVSITHDTVLPYSPERVWSMLTESSAIERWLMPNTFEPRLGHRFTLKTNPIPAFNFDGIINCEVVEIDPPKRLVHTWVGGGLDTRVTYRLEQEGEGTHLYMEHSGFDLDSPVGQMAYHGMGSGWKDILGQTFPRLMDELIGASR